MKLTFINHNRQGIKKKGAIMKKKLSITFTPPLIQDSRQSIGGIIQTLITSDNVNPSSVTVSLNKQPYMLNIYDKSCALHNLFKSNREQSVDEQQSTYTQIRPLVESILEKKLTPNIKLYTQVLKESETHDLISKGIIVLDDRNGHHIIGFESFQEPVPLSPQQKRRQSLSLSSITPTQIPRHSSSPKTSPIQLPRTLSEPIKEVIKTESKWRYTSLKKEAQQPAFEIKKGTLTKQSEEETSTKQKKNPNCSNTQEDQSASLNENNEKNEIKILDIQFDANKMIESLKTEIETLKESYIKENKATILDSTQNSNKRVHGLIHPFFRKYKKTPNERIIAYVEFNKQITKIPSAKIFHSYYEKNGRFFSQYDKQLNIDDARKYDVHGSLWVYDKNSPETMIPKSYALKCGVLFVFDENNNPLRKVEFSIGDTYNYFAKCTITCLKNNHEKKEDFYF